MIKLRHLKKVIFTPLSWVWDWVYRIRRSCYEYGFLKKNYFKVPVVSVGNITFGGTGKTPTILWLADYISQQGLTPVVLTRGYKGLLEHSAGLLKSGQRFRLNPHDYGDEPLMIASKMKNGAVIVGKKRAQNLIRFFPEVKPDVVLLDDGFQHLNIYRSFNLVLFDAMLPLVNYQTAPLGYLREGLSALKDADAIIVSRANMADEERLKKLKNFLSQYFHHGPLWCEMGYKPIGLFDGYDSFRFRVDDLQGKDIIAVTAIASPESFFNSLEDFGANLVERVSFPDHYFFTQEDVNNLLLQASRHSAMIVCSEKDMVKLRRVSQDPRLYFLKVQVEFLSGEDSLKEALGKVLHLEASGLSL
jgi:tetraacyldisaccharide 4'-kinase